jgi:hypothetical protein
MLRTTLHVAAAIHAAWNNTENIKERCAETSIEKTPMI